MNDRQPLPVVEIGASTYRARCSYCGLSALVRRVRLETGGHGYRCSVCKKAQSNKEGKA